MSLNVLKSVLVFWKSATRRFPVIQSQAGRRSVPGSVMTKRRRSSTTFTTSTCWRCVVLERSRTNTDAALHLRCSTLCRGCRRTWRSPCESRDRQHVNDHNLISLCVTAVKVSWRSTVMYICVIAVKVFWRSTVRSAACWRRRSLKFIRRSQQLSSRSTRWQSTNTSSMPTGQEITTDHAPVGLWLPW